MSSESNQQFEGERGNTVDQVAELLMQEDAPEEASTEEQANFRFNDDDLVDESEEWKLQQRKSQTMRSRISKQTTPMS